MITYTENLSDLAKSVCLEIKLSLYIYIYIYIYICVCVCVCVCVYVAQSMIRASAREDNPRVSASGLSPVHTRESHPKYYASCALLDTRC